MIPTIEQINEAIVKQKELAGEYFAGWYEEEISFALRFTKKIMGEPSFLMEISGSIERRDQAIKEVENETN